MINWSFEQYEDKLNFVSEIFSATEENRGCVLLFDELLDSNQEVIDAFVPEENKEVRMFRKNTSFFMSLQKALLETKVT